MKDEMMMSQSAFSRSSKMKRLRLISVAAVLLAVCLAFVGGAAGAEDVWDGTADISWYNDVDTEFTLTTAEQLAGLAELVDDSDTFEGKTIKLGADIDLSDENGNRINFNPIGHSSNGKSFNGIFDGQHHTIKNLYEQSNLDSNNGGWLYEGEYYGLFAYTNGATIQNLKIEDAYISSGRNEAACVVGNAVATKFFNIDIINATLIAYNNSAGGVAAECYGECSFENITVDEDTVIGPLWGTYDVRLGGVVGMVKSSDKVSFSNVNVACQLDAINDVAANYQYWLYRYCGMLIGEVTGVNGVADPTGYVTCENVEVTYGDWVNYHYCEFESLGAGSYNGPGEYKYARVEAGTGTDGIDLSTCNHSEDESHNVLIVFDQLFGGGQGVSGLKTYDGVTVYYYPFTVIFHNNTGEGEMENQIVYTNTKGSLKQNTFVKEGHRFTGWNTQEKGAVNPYADNSDIQTLVKEEGQNTPNREIHLYAQWEENKYTITFDTDGGSEISAITQNYATDVTAPANPTKTGYTFSNWNPEIPATMPAEDMTVIAQWVANRSTVTFNAGEGTVSETLKTVTFDQPYGKLPTPTRDGYEFVGWYLNDKQITAETTVNVDKDHTLTAEWKEITTPPTSSGGSGISGYESHSRTTKNGGSVDFGASKVVKGVILPEGSSGSVVLKVDTIEGWTNILETEYTFDISVQTMGDGMAYILFEIPLRTLENLGITPADVCAYHFVDGEWVMLKTTYEVKEGTVFYEAETDSFSPFKLVFEEGTATPKEAETEPVIPPTEEPDVPDEPETLPPIDEPVDEPETPAPLLAVLAGLGAAVVLRRK